MKDISYYSKDAIKSRMSLRQSIGHDVTKYQKHTEYGVTKIYYHIDTTDTMDFFAVITIIPQ